MVGGAGHVGIPLVLSFAAKGLSVNVNDLNKETLARCKAGRLPFIEHGAESVLTKALADKRLIFTSRPNESPTGPGHRHHRHAGRRVPQSGTPRRPGLHRCAAAALADGRLLVLRSTLFPGTTDWLASYLQRKGRKLKVAFCPERVVQGYGIEELRDMPQIVSGTTPEAEPKRPRCSSDRPGDGAPQADRGRIRQAVQQRLPLYRIRGHQPVLSDREIRRLGLPARAQAMKHNYPRAEEHSRPGFAAGPCLVKDTMQLRAFARNEFALGNAAMLVNEGLALHIIGDLRRRYDSPR